MRSAARFVNIQAVGYHCSRLSTIVLHRQAACLSNVFAKLRLDSKLHDICTL